MYIRYSVILKHFQGLTNKDIAKLENLEEHTVGRYIKNYNAKGIEGLVMNTSPGAPRKLSPKQEEKLVDDLIYMFRTCEKYSSISQKSDDLDMNDAYSFDMVSNRGTDVRTQTYILPEKDKRQAEKLENQIMKHLSGDNNVDVCTLLSILNKKMNK